MNRQRASLIGIVAASFAIVASSQEPPPSPDDPSSRPHAGSEHSRPGGPGQFFHSLTPEQQKRFLKLLDEWSKLTAAQRQEILAKSEQDPEKREQLRRSLEPFEQMPPDQRERLRKRMHEWQAMSPEEQEKFRQREQEMRQKAEQELTDRLAELGLQPGREQMRWIRQFYFQKKRELMHKVNQRVRDLKGQGSADVPDEEKQKLREQVQAYRQELEQQLKKEFEEFARNPHPVPPPKELHAEGSRGEHGTGPNHEGRPGGPADRPPDGGVDSSTSPSQRPTPDKSL